jgi:hypothetical protein
LKADDIVVFVLLRLLLLLLLLLRDLLLRHRRHLRRIGLGVWMVVGIDNAHFTLLSREAGTECERENGVPPPFG